jgi:hypothetical protein
MLTLALASLVAAATASPGHYTAPIRAEHQQRFEKGCLPLPNGWRRQGCEFGELATVNLLEMRNNRLVWNGRAISCDTLQRYLLQTHRLLPRPGLAFVVDAASSKQAAAVTRKIINSQVSAVWRTCVSNTQPLNGDRRSLQQRPMFANGRRRTPHDGYCARRLGAEN